MRPPKRGEPMERTKRALYLLELTLDQAFETVRLDLYDAVGDEVGQLQDVRARLFSVSGDLDEAAAVLGADEDDG